MKQRHASKHLTGLVGMRGSEFHNTRIDGICKKCGQQAWELDATDLCPCWKLRLPKLKAPISNQRESQEAPHPQDK